MGNSNDGGCLVILMWAITIGVSIGSGIMAWNWIEPESFIGAIGFLIVWAILSKIGHFLGMGIMLIFNDKN